MTAAEEIATETWTVEPYTDDEIAMHIMSQSGAYGPFRILRNVNLEDDEMHAIAALPELFALALAVVEQGGPLASMAQAALEKATRKER